VRIKEFLDQLREAATFAQIGSHEPEIIVRRADDTEFTPAKLKFSTGKIIICESLQS
jgi:hypothetical protein